MFRDCVSEVLTRAGLLVDCDRHCRPSLTTAPFLKAGRQMVAELIRRMLLPTNILTSHFRTTQIFPMWRDNKTTFWFDKSLKEASATRLRRRSSISTWYRDGPSACIKGTTSAGEHEVRVSTEPAQLGAKEAPDFPIHTA